jgi:hypothetical protein
MKIGSIVVPWKGMFKGLQCVVVEFDGASLVKIAHGNHATWEWYIDLDVIGY